MLLKEKPEFYSVFLPAHYLKKNLLMAEMKLVEECCWFTWPSAMSITACGISLLTGLITC